MELKTLSRICYGMYLISSRDGEKLNAQVANTVFQVTSEPAKIAVALNKQNLTCDFIKKCGIFSVTILSQSAPMEFIGRFGFKSGKNFDKFEKVDYKTGVTGIPVITENSVGYIEAKVTGQLDAGTHIVFVAEVIDANISSESEPMTYAYYHNIKKGSSPKTAPTYVKEGTAGGGKQSVMDKYKCTICGYVYDPALGDPDNGVNPQTPFEKVPDTWVCPVCGAGKEVFEKEV